MIGNNALIGELIRDMPPSTPPPVPNAYRQQVAGDPSLGEELLRAFHDSEDPAPLTELLRLFSTAALMRAATPVGAPAAAASKSTDEKAAFEDTAGVEAAATSGTPGDTARMSDVGTTVSAGAAAPEAPGDGAGGLASWLAERETLRRLAFFLENSLEERLLAWVRLWCTFIPLGLL